MKKLYNFLRLRAFVSQLPTATAIGIGLTLTLIISFLAWKITRNEDYRKFTEVVDEIETPLRSRMIRYQGALIQVKAFFVSQNLKVTREEFETYVANMELLENYPGAQGLGFSLLIRPNEHQFKKGRFGYLGDTYQVWPVDPSRDEYFSIVYLFPQDWRNKRAIGFDMYSDPIRRKAMETARDTGRPAVTGKVVLVQETEIETQPGFVLYVPVYKPQFPITTAQERREALVGFVSAPFRSFDFMNAIAYASLKPVDYELYSDSERKENLLYTNRVGKKEIGLFFQRREIEIAGQKFILTARSRPEFTSVSRRLFPLMIAIIGLLVTLLLYFIIYRLRKNAEIERESREALETLNRIGKNVSAELDLDKVVQEITDAATQISKAQFGALFYNLINQQGESYTLYTISGVPKEMFTRFPLPRNTEVFKPTFANLGVVRSDDITKDPQYGKNAPYFGMPQGHLPVRSYLAVSVVSRSGEVLGGLFFGHKDIGVFTEREERLVVGLAAQAAIAIDNANLYKKAQEAIRARDEFLSICSHELKTPLTSLQLEAQINQRLMARKGDEALTPGRFKELIETTVKQTSSLTSLVDDMLDVGRISTGRLKLHPDNLGFRKLLTDCVDQVEPLYRAQGVKLDIVLPDSDVQVNWDKQRVMQVVTNLLSNALKYGKKLPVLLKVEQYKDEIQISVTDSGIGVSDENQSRIFQRFERAIHDPNISGFGLGLYISKKFVEAHKGKISLKSKLAEGSTFTVSLPISPRYSTDALDLQ